MAILYQNSIFTANTSNHLFYNYIDNYPISKPKEIDDRMKAELDKRQLIQEQEII